MRAVVHDRYGPPRGAPASTEVERPVPDRRRGARQGPRHDGHAHGLPHSRGEAVLLARLRRTAPAEAEDPRHRVRGGGRGRRRGRHGVRRSVTRSSAAAPAGSARTPSTSASGRAPPLAHKPAGMSFEEAAAVCDGFVQAASALQTAELRQGDSASSSTAPPGHWGRLPCSWPGTWAPTSPLSAGRRTSSSCGRSAPTRSSTTSSATTRRTARRTTSSSTPSGFHFFSQCRRSIRPGGVFVPTELGRLMVENLLADARDEAVRQAARAVRGRPVVEAGRPLPQGADRGRGVPSRRSTARTRSRRWSRRRGTWRRCRRRATSSCASTAERPR